MTSDPMLHAFTPSGQRSFYAASLQALRFVEARRASGRRFGPDADARWKDFRGDLNTADRIDLLIRDANAEWPEAFGARTAFGLRAVAEDEPFGPEWQPLEAVEAEDLWRASLKGEPPSSVRTVLDLCAAAWDLRLTWPAMPSIAPVDRILLVGPSAVAAAIVAFFDATALDWAAQVTCVASVPAHRHLAALAGGFLSLTKPAGVVAVDDGADLSTRRRGFASHDAHPDDLVAAKAALGDLLTVIDG